MQDNSGVLLLALAALTAYLFLGMVRPKTPNSKIGLGTVVIDPGHGLPDPGAVAASGLTEQEINLAVALRLKKLFEQEGARVLLTRSQQNDPIPTESFRGQRLQTRVTLANTQNADLYLSIHNNSIADSTAKGTECLYSNNASRPLAEAISRNVAQKINTPNRGAKQRNDLYVLVNQPGRTAVLVEGDFLSNPAVAAQMRTSQWQTHLAEGILQGVLEWRS